MDCTANSQDTFDLTWYMIVADTFSIWGQTVGMPTTWNWLLLSWHVFKLCEVVWRYHWIFAMYSSYMKLYEEDITEFLESDGTGQLYKIRDGLSCEMPRFKFPDLVSVIYSISDIYQVQFCWNIVTILLCCCIIKFCWANHSWQRGPVMKLHLFIETAVIVFAWTLQVHGSRRVGDWPQVSLAIDFSMLHLSKLKTGPGNNERLK